MPDPIKLYLTYDDVLLVPARGLDFAPKSSITKNKVTRKILLDLPVIASGMPSVTESEMAITMGQFGATSFIHPFLSYNDYASEIKKVKTKNLVVGGAVADGDFERAVVAYESGADFIAIDAGHGHNDKSLNFIKKIKKKYPKKEIMAGCFATPEGVYDAIKSGADSVRVGIGPGSHCTTRVVSGVGVPMLSMIIDCAPVAKKYKVPLIAEGGIRFTGDVAKAVGAGASGVIIGGMFSGTDESPGEVIEIDGKKYKQSWGYSTNKADEMAGIRGQGKVGVKRKVKNMIKGIFRRSDGSAYKMPQKKIVEGVENAKVIYKGSVKDILQLLKDGLKLGMAYCGSQTVQEFQRKAKFIRITNAGLTESFPHDVITD